MGLDGDAQRQAIISGFTLLVGLSSIRTPLARRTESLRHYGRCSPACEGFRHDGGGERPAEHETRRG